MTLAVPALTAALLRRRFAWRVVNAANDNGRAA